jgi:hypothetical protein
LIPSPPVLAISPGAALFRCRLDHLQPDEPLERFALHIVLSVAQLLLTDRIRELLLRDRLAVHDRDWIGWCGRLRRLSGRGQRQRQTEREVRLRQMAFLMPANGGPAVGTVAESWPAA